MGSLACRSAGEFLGTEAPAQAVSSSEPAASAAPAGKRAAKWPAQWAVRPAEVVVPGMAVLLLWEREAVRER